MIYTEYMLENNNKYNNPLTLSASLKVRLFVSAYRVKNKQARQEVNSQENITLLKRKDNSYRNYGS